MTAPEKTPISVAKSQLFAGAFQQAFATAQSLLRNDPDATEALLILACVALEHGNVSGARDIVKIAQSRGETSGWAAVIAGRIALLGSDTADARAQARLAMERGVADPDVAGQLGVLLSRTGLHGEAIPHLARAVAARPEDAQYRYNLAIAQQFAGDLDAARAGFETLVADHPRDGRAWLALVQLDRQPDRHRLPTLEAAFAAATEADQKLPLGHAIAKTLEDVGAWDEALGWLDRAKAAKSSAIRHDRAEVDACFAAAKAGTAAIGAAASNEDPAPIFITGLPRSGTTLVERIIASHPDVRSAGELSDFAILLKRRLRTPGPLVLDAATLHAGITADLHGVGDDYVRRARTIVGDTPRFIDKMPFNIFYVPLILRALPNARILCLRRSPFDTLFSNYRQLFATSFTYYSYAYDFEDTADFVAGFESLADHYAASLPPDRYRTQSYEALVDDQRGQTEAILDFLGLDWNDACLDFHRSAAPVATASSVQVRKPLYRDSIERWRRYTQGSDRAITALGQWGITP
jgi:tetratricopeptide (TPR) repeat protein